MPSSRLTMATLTMAILTIYGYTHYGYTHCDRAGDASHLLTWPQRRPSALSAARCLNHRTPPTRRGGSMRRQRPPFRPRGPKPRRPPTPRCPPRGKWAASRRLTFQSRSSLSERNVGPRRPNGREQRWKERWKERWTTGRARDLLVGPRWWLVALPLRVWLVRGETPLLWMSVWTLVTFVASDGENLGFSHLSQPL